MKREGLFEDTIWQTKVLASVTRTSTTVGRFPINDGIRVKIIQKNLSLDESAMATPGFRDNMGSISSGPNGGDPAVH